MITGSTPTLAITDVCGQMTSTDDGVAQPLSVSLTVTDNLGASATATAGSGVQPALQVRLFTCGSVSIRPSEVCLTDVERQHAVAQGFSPAT